MEKKNWKFKLGLTLIILSVFVFASLLLIPFLKIDARDKITVTTIIIVIGEITFWSGGLLLGKELFKKYTFFYTRIEKIGKIVIYKASFEIVKLSCLLA